MRVNLFYELGTKLRSQVTPMLVCLSKWIIGGSNYIFHLARFPSSKWYVSCLMQILQHEKSQAWWSLLFTITWLDSSSYFMIGWFAHRPFSRIWQNRGIHQFEENEKWHFTWWSSNSTILRAINCPPRPALSRRTKDRHKFGLKLIHWWSTSS